MVVSFSPYRGHDIAYMEAKYVSPPEEKYFYRTPNLYIKTKEAEPWRCINVDTPVVDSGFPVGRASTS